MICGKKSFRFGLSLSLQLQRAWEVDLDGEPDFSGEPNLGGELDLDSEDDFETAAPSEAFLSLKKELNDKERIQQENRRMVEEQEAVAAKAANILQKKVRFLSCPCLVSLTESSRCTCLVHRVRCSGMGGTQQILARQICLFVV